MRLKSPFKDYYDGLLKMDEDSEPLFLRHTQIDYDTWPLPYHGIGPGSIPCSNINPEVVSIGFCGRVFPAIRMAPDQPWIFSIGAVDSYIEQNFKKRQVEDYRNKTWRHKLTPNWCYCHGRNQFLELFRVYNNLFATSGIFDSLLIPTFLVRRMEYVEQIKNPHRDRREVLIKNPRLSDYNLAKIIPPYQAYQEIRMWLSNVAWPNKPIPEVSDKDMIVAKGFDLKTSFRKQKD